MPLDDIGFYTLSDKRAREVSWSSPLKRCELILTDRCNFKCAYCRGIKDGFRGDTTLEQAKIVVDIWSSGGVENIRFSGGEPTIWPGLIELVKYTKTKSSIKHIAISTNGSADIELYKELCKAGVNDFSISLDACCSSMADKMAGVDSKFEHISEAIRELGKLTYVTAGIVVDRRNDAELAGIIRYASSLGVSDIRIIPSAQSNHRLIFHGDMNMPILKYRVENINNGKHIRGLGHTDTGVCHLVKDDMVVLKGFHFPCVIQMREQGEPIGSVYGKSISEIRAERRGWLTHHDSHKDPICKRNCLDVCIAHNNAVEEYNKKNS